MVNCTTGTEKETLVNIVHDVYAERCGRLKWLLEYYLLGRVSRHMLYHKFGWEHLDGA